ncbi:MAG TPA: branched-chain amino acid ABC transporter permease [Ktedonobacterales bacterium]|nr:branched-chain amino acid ABC transporter permease [Ktedonobacterales bacterium]
MLATVVKYRPFAYLLLLIVAISMPWYAPGLFPGISVMSIAVLTVIFAGAASSWNIFSGYTGYIALGHAVFFGTGAYALAIICQDWHVKSDYGPMMLLPIAGLVAAVVAVPLGLISLRTRGHTFVVITIAMFFIAQLLAYNLRAVTHGSAGLELPIPSWSGDAFDVPFYYVGLLILLLTLATSWWVRRSKYGLGLLAIRDDEDRARGLGVKTGSSKLLAFVLSAFFVGMLGGLWAYYIESVFPNSGFDAIFDVSTALMAFLGGLGTLAGPILGALILVPAQQYVAADATLTSWYLVLYGAVFLAVILLLPEGIIPTIRKRLTRWLARRAAPAAIAGGTPPANQRDPVSAATRDGGDR